MVTVPTGAVQRGPLGAFAFILGPDDVVHRHPITVSRQDETVAVVTAGLQPGQLIVTDGASRLTEASHVRRLQNNPTDMAKS